jgi:transcriptional regulator with XRE-family HTH domain
MAINTSLPQGLLQALLADLRAERGESLSEFGRLLARVINPDARPFSRSYISKLEHGAAPITPEIAAAIGILGAMMDGQSEVQARARRVSVLAVHDLSENVIVMGRERGCALPGCRVRFVRASPAQRYCSQECRSEMRIRRRMATRL